MKERGRSNKDEESIIKEEYKEKRTSCTTKGGRSAAHYWHFPGDILRRGRRCCFVLCVVVVVVMCGDKREKGWSEKVEVGTSKRQKGRVGVCDSCDVIGAPEMDDFCLK